MQKFVEEVLAYLVREMSGQASAALAVGHGAYLRLISESL
jgi:hypothetical protein